jgi:tetratricopeptide (TPR) repeat protein
MVRARFILVLLLVICFSLAAWVQPRRETRLNQSLQTDNVLADLLGEGRQLAADYFYVKADVYFHSGYYPSLFDEARQAEVKDADVSHPEATNAPSEEGFLGPPQDWIDRFSRHFKPARHTHLGGEAVAEMLPWMQLSSDLDPHRIQTYIVTSYFLRNYLGKLDDARQFLRAGVRANPDSPELQYELGRLYFENYKDLPPAKNVWLGALKTWEKVEAPKPDKTPTGEGRRDIRLLGRIYDSLAEEELESGRTNQAIAYFQLSKPNSPFPESVQKRIDGLETALQRSGGTTNRPPEKLEKIP